MEIDKELIELRQIKELHRKIEEKEKDRFEARECIGTLMILISKMNNERSEARKCIKKIEAIISRNKTTAQSLPHKEIFALSDWIDDEF